MKKFIIYVLACLLLFCLADCSSKSEENSSVSPLENEQLSPSVLENTTTPTILPLLNITLSPPQTTCLDEKRAANLSDVIDTGVVWLSTMTDKDQVWNLETGEHYTYDELAFGENTRGGVPSPSKKYFLIYQQIEDEPITEVLILSAEIKILKTIYLEPEWLNVAWVNDDQLLFDRKVDNDSTIMVYNLITDAERVIELPEANLFVDDDNIEVTTWHVLLSPDQTTIAYLDKDGATVLYDVDEKKTLWKSTIDGRNLGVPPKWSVSGDYLASVNMENTESLILMTRLGNFLLSIPNAGFTPNMKDIVYPINEYEWSPDERYLAVALNNSYGVKIFFVEMPSGKVIDYCIEMDGLLDKFLWGPEGHQLLLLAHENTHAEDVYINLDEPGVYRFDQQSYPYKWFAAGVTSISP